MTVEKSEKQADVLRIVFTITGVVAAIGLAWAVGWTAGSDAERRSGMAAELVEIADIECAELERMPAVECISRGVLSAAAAIGTNQDLVAQQTMARGTWLMAIASILALIVTALGVWLLKRTLDATLAAVDETRAATATMVEANQIARETTRAWLVVEDVRFGVFELLEGPAGTTLAYHSMDVLINNVGKLPALGVKVTVRVQETQISGTNNKVLDTIVPGTTIEVTNYCVYTVEDLFWDQSQGHGGTFSLEIEVEYHLHGDPTVRVTRQSWECGRDTRGDGLASIARSNFQDSPAISSKGLLAATKEMT